MVMALRKLQCLEKHIFNVLFLWLCIPTVNSPSPPYFDCHKQNPCYSGNIQYCIVIEISVWNLYTWKLWPHRLDHDSNNWVHSQHGSAQYNNQRKWGKLHLLTSHPKTCTAVRATVIWISHCTWSSALCFT